MIRRELLVGLNYLQGDSTAATLEYLEDNKSNLDRESMPPRGIPFKVLDWSIVALAGRRESQFPPILLSSEADVPFTSSISDHSWTAAGSSATILQTGRFRKKRLKSDGHLITEDSVLPTTAPGGAPEQNRCYQTPALLLVLTLAPRFVRALGAPRTAHYATPPLGAGAF